MLLRKNLGPSILILVMAFLLAGCGFTHMTLDVIPKEVEITEETETVELEMEIAFEGTGFVTVYEILVGLRDRNSEFLVDPETDEELIWEEVVNKTVPAKTKTTIKKTIEVSQQQAWELGLDHILVAVTGTRPVEAIVKVSVEPPPSQEPEGSPDPENQG